MNDPGLAGTVNSAHIASTWGSLYFNKGVYGLGTLAALTDYIGDVTLTVVQATGKLQLAVSTNNLGLGGAAFPGGHFVDDDGSGWASLDLVRVFGKVTVTGTQRTTAADVTLPSSGTFTLTLSSTNGFPDPVATGAGSYEAWLGTQQIAYTAVDRPNKMLLGCTVTLPFVRTKYSTAGFWPSGTNCQYHPKIKIPTWIQAIAANAPSPTSADANGLPTMNDTSWSSGNGLYTAIDVESGRIIFQQCEVQANALATVYGGDSGGDSGCIHFTGVNDLVVGKLVNIWHHLDGTKFGAGCVNCQIQGGTSAIHPDLWNQIGTYHADLMNATHLDNTNTGPVVTSFYFASGKGNSGIFINDTGDSDKWAWNVYAENCLFSVENKSSDTAGSDYSGIQYCWHDHNKSPVPLDIGSGDAKHPFPTNQRVVENRWDDTKALVPRSAAVGTIVPQADLVVEVDWTGNPTATYLDTLTSGAVSYWRMNGTTVGVDTLVLLDEKAVNTGLFPNALPLSFLNKPTPIPGALPNDTNQALRFDGTNDYGSVTSSNSLREAGSYSVSGFLRFPTLPSASRPIWTKGSYRLEVTAANKLMFSVQNHVSGVATLTQATAVSTLLANTWYHVTCVHDATNRQLRLYVDGVLETTVAHTAGTELWGLPFLFAAKHSGTVPAYGASGAILSITGATWTVAAPAGITAGQLLMVHAWTSSSNTAGGVWTLPTGWITQASTASASGQNFLLVAYKIADASDVGATSYTFTKTGTNASLTIGQMVVSRFTGVDTATPFANPVYMNEANSSVAATGNKYSQSDDVLTVGLANMNRKVSWSSTDGTERYDTGGVNAPGTGIAMYTQPVTSQSAVSKFDMTANGSQTNAGVWLALKGSDAQDFSAVDLNEWTFHNSAFTDVEVKRNYQSRLSGVGTWVQTQTNGLNDHRGAALKHGRQYELNRMEAGTASTALKNQHRRYDPANTSSIYYPNVKPNRKIRFRALLNGVYYPMFEGFVERWPSNWGVPNYDQVEVSASDGFKMFSRADVSALLDAAPSGTQIGVVLDRALWPSDRRSIDAGLFVMAADTTTTGTVKAQPLIEDIADSELGIFFLDHTVDGSPATFHDRSHRWTTTRSLISQAVFSDQLDYISYHDLQPSLDDDNLVNAWTVASSDGTEATAVDVTSRSENFAAPQSRSTRLDNPADALTQATGLLQLTSKPGLRFDVLELKLSRMVDSAIWQTAFGLAISDRVTVIREPVPAAGGSTITKDCFIEGIEWAIDPNLWVVRYQLSPVSTAGYEDTVLLDDPVSYWRMDT